MLGGVRPLLIFNLKSAKLVDLFSDTPLLASIASVGVPVFAIPLTEHNIAGQNSAILIDNENSSIDLNTTVDTLVQTDASGEPAEVQVTQRAIDSQITLGLTGSRESLFTVILSALMQQLFDRSAAGTYSIHYLNGPTAVFGAKLVRFARRADPNSTLVFLEVILSTASGEPPTPKPEVDTFSKVQDALPNVGGVL